MAKTTSEPLLQDEQLQDEGTRVEEEQIQEPKLSIFDTLDAPRELPDPVKLTAEHLKQISNELGLIQLCWSDKHDAEFEGRTHFPESYTQNNMKERLVLLCAENFRKQFCFRFPNRKPLLLASDNECGVQKMVCTTLRPTTLSYTEIDTWQTCAKFVAAFLKYEPLKIPILFPDHLYSPHTVFTRQSGHVFEFSTCLCSLLIGLGYDAYIVSGYASDDATKRTMCRTDSPYPPQDEVEKVEEIDEAEKKYVMKPVRDLRSKFHLMMEQREVDKIKGEEEQELEKERLRREDEERPPPDELQGLRIHSWILVLPDGKKVDKVFFIDPTTGLPYDLTTPSYYGIESVWNHINYWVNMQDCSRGLDKISYELSNTDIWEHLLIGEPIQLRKDCAELGMDDDDYAKMKVSEEKHLDMPPYWSERINIPHSALKAKFPGGKKKTWYKRELVEEYAPYVQEDGLVAAISRFSDFECKELKIVEGRYENRHDKLYKIVHDVTTRVITEYFSRGREDAVRRYQYEEGPQTLETNKEIIINHEARSDGMARIIIKPEYMEVHYIDRDDRIYYREIHYAKKTPGVAEGHRKVVNLILEKFYRDPNIPASDDIAQRQFVISKREIKLRFHYGPGKVTASTRNFTKPPLEEMGERLKFNPQLTSGYQAEIDAKPIRHLKLFLLLREQIKDEENAFYVIREMEDQILEFLQVREKERIANQLDVSLFNIEENTEYREGMLEREKQYRQHKDKEVEEKIDYLAVEVVKLNKNAKITYELAFKIRNSALTDFKNLLLKRANDIQRQYDRTNEMLNEQKSWYIINQDTISHKREAEYFDYINKLKLIISALEVRLTRHKELSYYKYRSMLNYLDNHPLLRIMNTSM